MPRKTDQVPQRSCEELLPTPKLRESWITLLNERRDAHRAKDEKKAESAFQYGMGFLEALHRAELLRAGDKADLSELLLSPNLHR
jgi:hypothetical protein